MGLSLLHQAGLRPEMPQTDGKNVQCSPFINWERVNFPLTILIRVYYIDTFVGSVLAQLTLHTPTQNSNVTEKRDDQAPRVMGPHHTPALQGPQHSCLC